MQALRAHTRGGPEVLGRDLDSRREGPDADHPVARMADRYGVTAIFFIVATDSDELAKLARLVDAWGLRVTIARTFPLADGRAAYAAAPRPTENRARTVLTVRR
jgi:NADPH:quinone reductase-like Zn-dependent oxidoreductase